MDYTKKLANVVGLYFGMLHEFNAAFYESAGRASGLSQSDFLAAMAGSMFKSGVAAQLHSLDLSAELVDEITAKVVAVFAEYAPGTTVKVSPLNAA